MQYITAYQRLILIRITTNKITLQQGIVLYKKCLSKHSILSILKDIVYQKLVGLLLIMLNNIMNNYHWMNYNHQVNNKQIQIGLVVRAVMIRLAISCLQLRMLIMRRFCARTMNYVLINPCLESIPRAKEQNVYKNEV